jgi:hypothetical protein
MQRSSKGVARKLGFVTLFYAPGLIFRALRHGEIEIRLELGLLAATVGGMLLGWMALSSWERD